MGPLDFVATPQMIRCKGSFQVQQNPFVLSDAATAFIRDNDLGNFEVSCGVTYGIVITAPDEYSATIFRLAF